MSPNKCDLHVPHKQAGRALAAALAADPVDVAAVRKWAAEDEENWMAVERWAAHLVRNCLSSPT